MRQPPVPLLGSGARCDPGRASSKAVLLSAMLALALAAVGAAEDPLEGLPIVRIVLVRQNIFDTTQPETSSWPYRFANSIHVVSRESFIRSMIIIKEGEAYSERRAAETARVLRSLGFLNPVDVQARRVDDGVEVTITTHDKWTLQIDAQAGITGNRSETAFEFKEKNFLGWGKSVSIGWESNNERDSLITEYADPNILGTRWRGLVIHEDSSDGYHDRVRVDRPFFSLATEVAWGVDWNDERAQEHLYSESRSQVHGLHLNDGWRLWGGLRLPSDGETTRRVVVGYDYQRDAFADWSWRANDAPYEAPSSRRIGGMLLGYEQIVDDFVVLTGFRAWSAQEDQALGPNFRLGLVVSVPELGGDQDRYLFDGKLHRAQVRDGWLVLGDTWCSGRIEDRDFSNVVLGVEIAAAQLGPRGWQGRLMVETSHDLDRNLQLALGADTGLRGWDPDYFDGTGRAVANLQWRMLLKEDLFELFSVGLIVFADAGHTWGARVGPGTNRPHGDIGVGVLADMTHIGLDNLLRIDVGFPDDGSGWTVTVTSSPLF